MHRPPTRSQLLLQLHLCPVWLNFSGRHIPAFWAQPTHTKRPLPHRYLQLRWRKTGISSEISLGFHTLGNLCSAEYAGSLGIWNHQNSWFQGLLSKLKTLSVVKLDILNFLLVNALEITINDWLPQISLPLWMTLAQRSRHSVIEVSPRLLWPVDQQPYFGDMQNHPRIWQFADQHINCSRGYLVTSSPCMVILWSILW